MNTTSRRDGFTLVEMLIVLGIIILVAGIFVPIILNLTDRNQVPKGASLFENALSLAKARAVAEKRANGVRLVAAQDNLRTLAGSTTAFAWYDEIQYIEDPSDYVEAWVWGFSDPGPLPLATPPVPAPPIRLSSQPFFSGAFPIPGSLPNGLDDIAVASGPFTFQALTINNQINPVTVNRNFLLFGPISMAPPNTWQGALGIPRTSQRLSFNYRSGILSPDQPVNTFVDVPAVLPGDVIELTGVGEIYRIEAVSVDQGAFLNVNVSATAQPIRVPVLVLDRPLSTDVQVALNSRPNYRIIRKPRTVPSLQPLKLPQDVVIDLTPSRVPFLGLGPQSDWDQNTNSIYMSGVSTGIQVSGVSGLTIPPGPIQAKAPRYVDIMFSPSGEIMPTNQTFGNPATGPVSTFSVGASGLIALWLHQRGDANLWAQRQITAAQGNADNQAIVAINGRTGFIGSYPINKLTPDPLANARLGRARSSADTGP